MDKLAIFDLDGTLLNTIEDIADACNYALQKQGFPVHPVNPYKYFVGNGVMNLLERALPEGVGDGITLTRMKKDYDEYYSVHGADKTRPYPGIKKAVERLREADIRTAVLSNKPHASTVGLVERYFPGLFDVVYGQRDGIPHKPDPAGVLDIVKMLEADNIPGYYIGDTYVDIETGKSAGLVTVGVLWGYRTREELEKSGADIIIDKSEDLIKVIVDNDE